MVFSSFTFLFLYLPIVLLLYYIVPSNKKIYKNFILFIFSLLFYAWGEPIYIILMIFSIVNDYVHAIIIDYFKSRNQYNKAKIALFSSVVINLGLLGFFKYGDFLINNVNQLLGLKISLLNIPLPIGISFYTFQTMSYTIDVYRGNVKAQKNFLTLATYIALFPQLIAGPIVRYITIEDELSNRRETVDQFADGLRRFIIGLAKKVIIANNVALLADAVFNNNPNEFGTIIIWLATIAYAFQIYFDFSGYSDMAIGLGKMFGFNFLENFNYPYIAKSITDFWRRWHISLSTWFRDYVYIPLGGNRVTLLKWFRNILIVWFITGLWHGANWNYVLWGLYFGVILILEKFIILKLLDRLPKFINHLYAIILILIGWVIFRVENIENLLQFISRMFVYSKSDMYVFFSNYDETMHLVPYFIIGIIGSMPLVKNLLSKMNNSKNDWIGYIHDIYIIFIFGVTIVYLVSSTFNPFIYFRF